SCLFSARRRESDARSVRMNGHENARLFTNEAAWFAPRALFLWLVDAGFGVLDGRVGGKAPPETWLDGNTPCGERGADAMSAPSAESEEWHRIIRAWVRECHRGGPGDLPGPRDGPDPAAGRGTPARAGDAACAW